MNYKKNLNCICFMYGGGVSLIPQIAVMSIFHFLKNRITFFILFYSKLFDSHLFILKKNPFPIIASLNVSFWFCCFSVYNRFQFTYLQIKHTVKHVTWKMDGSQFLLLKDVSDLFHGQTGLHGGSLPYILQCL